MIAVLEAKRAGLLSRKHWVNNILAGAIVGIIALLLLFMKHMSEAVSVEQQQRDELMEEADCTCFTLPQIQSSMPWQEWVLNQGVLPYFFSSGAHKMEGSL
ncbi:MAG: hypothetical protein HY937_08355 [Nitrosomonadales bacterium]|nr:hypothetical protein [Nitrosomonadales bacterium]